MKDGITADQNAAGNAGYERSDVNLKWVIIFAFATVAVLVSFLVILNDFFAVEKEQIISEQVLSKDNPLLLEIRQRDQEILTGYRVIDAEKGIYGIPVKQAMQIIISEKSAQ